MGWDSGKKRDCRGYLELPAFGTTAGKQGGRARERDAKDGMDRDSGGTMPGRGGVKGAGLLRGVFFEGFGGGDETGDVGRGLGTEMPVVFVV